MKKSLLLLFVLLSAIGLRAQDATVVGDTLSVDVVTVMEKGKVYILGEKNKMYKVSFTATADGFLSITPSQKVNSTSFKINGAGSTFTKVDGGFSKKGMAAGSMFEGTFYTSGTPSADNTYSLAVTFEEGTPYESLTMTECLPADNGEWSGASIYYTTYATYKGQAYYNFSSAIDTKEIVASIKIGEKVYSPVTVSTAKNGVVLKAMPDTMNVAVAAGLIKPGDTFTVTLSNIKDKEFAANVLADQTFTYTLASTACTGVTPAASTSRQVLPEEVVFSFDGAVKIDNAKFYFWNKNTDVKTELVGVLDGNSVKITVPVSEGLPPKSYEVIAEGVTDENGKVITYGATAGQLTVVYGSNNSPFKATMEPANYAEVTSLKTYTATLPGSVVYDASLATDTVITLVDPTSFEAIDTLTYEINENVITFTLSEEVTAPGDYRLSVPGKLFWSKEYYDAENLSTNTCYYLPSTYVTCTILPYGPTTVTPATGSMLNALKTITLEFDDVVAFDDDALVKIYKEEQTEDDLGWPSVSYVQIDSVYITPDYSSDKNTNKLFLDLGSIDSLGTYTVVVPAGAIWAESNTEKKIGEWTYTYTVDPEYWDPEWIAEIGEACTKEAPYQLVAGRKYEGSQMYNYLQYTAEVTGRVYFTPVGETSSLNLKLQDAEWSYVKTLSQNENGAYWMGVEAGQTYNLQLYKLGSNVQFQVTSEEGNPYEPIAYLGSSPATGSIYNETLRASQSYTKGAVDFFFTSKVVVDSLQMSIVLPTKENKTIDITEEVYIDSYQGGVWQSGKQIGYYVSAELADVMATIVSENGLLSGDKFQIVLAGVQDQEFASNKLAETVSVELVLATTVCTSVNPDPEYQVNGVPEELSLRFNNKVTGTGGTIVDVKSGTVLANIAAESFATSQFENWDGSMINETNITLPSVTLPEGSKSFAIELTEMKDSLGNVVTYGDEDGKFVLTYKLRDDIFKPVSTDPEDECDTLKSIKAIKLTFADNVNIHATEDMEVYVTCNYQRTYGTLSVDEADAKTVVVTFENELTAAGNYSLFIDKGIIYSSAYDATKEDLGVADGAIYNPYIDMNFTIPADLSATKVTNVTPAPYDENMWPAPTVNELPAEVVIEFEGNVKEIVSIYGEAPSMGGGWSTEGATIPEGADSLAYKLEDNKLTVYIADSLVSAVTMGQYTITITALGEDGKNIGYNLSDSFDDHIVVAYYVYKTLNMTESTPADGATVKELSSVTITFDDEIAECEIGRWTTPRLYDENYDYAAEVSVTFYGNQATFTFEPAVAANGYYELYVPADILFTDDYVSNSQMYLGFTVDTAYVEPVEELAILSATPENGSTVANLTKVEFKLNKEVGYIYKSMLIPADGGDDAASASLAQSETDSTAYTLDFTFDGFFADGAKLRKGVTYTLTLEAWASEEAYNYNQGTPEVVTLSYVGDAEEFKYSDVKFESITPAEDFVITDSSQNTFVVKFSGAVDMVEELTFVNLGQGATASFESVVANADKTEYTLTIGKDLLNSLRNEVYLVFAANDESGNRVQGNNGEELNSTFSVVYKTLIGVPDLTVTPDGAAELASIEAISIKCAEGIAPSWTAGNITLTDAAGNTIALNDPEAVVAEGASEWDTPTEWTVALAAKLETIGTYTLTIPAGYFNIGSTQGQVMNSKETVVVFNITQAAKDAEGIKGVTVDSEVVVYNIAGVVVAKGKASEILKNLNKGIYIVNGKKYIVK